VKQNQSPEVRAARQPAAIASTVFYRTHQRAPPTAYQLDIANFPYPLSFNALVRENLFQIYGKALRFLEQESSRQPMVKIW